MFSLSAITVLRRWLDCILRRAGLLFLAGALVCAPALTSAAERLKAQRSAAVPQGFGDFPVAHESGPVLHARKLILASRLARRYRTVITDAAKQEADFAGHFRVARWGCGTDCHGFAIIDLISGRTYTLPGMKYVAGVMGNGEERIDYRLDSRLFIITGALDDEREGKYFYEWTGQALRLLFMGPVDKEDMSDAAAGE